MAADTREADAGRQRAGLEPLTRFRRLARCRRVLHEPVEIHTRLLWSAEAAVTLSEVEEEFPFGVITQRGEGPGRRLER